MIRLTSGYFCAGADLNRDSFVTRAAPILGYMRGWHLSRVAAYARSRRWRYEEVAGDE